MISPRNLSPLPLMRLLWAPRALLVLIGGGACTLGVAWMGTMARFNASELAPEIESAVFGALLMTFALFGLPSLVGVIVGEASQELFRRPLTNRLPGVAKRVSGAAFTCGLLASGLTLACVHFAWQPLGLRLSVSSDELPCPLASLSIALLGFSAGSWLLVRVGYGWGWVLRFAGFFALAYFAHPLLVVGTHSIPVSLVVLAVSLFSATQRFRPGIVRRMAEGSVPTVFGDFREWGVDDPKAHERHPPKEDLLPQGAMGRDLTGWLRARSYEHRTLSHGRPAWRLLLIFAAIPIVAALIGPLVSWLTDQKGIERDLWGLLAGAILGSPEGTLAVARVHANGLLIFYGLAAASHALISSTPLPGKIFYPVSRSLRARLANRSALTGGLAFSATTLVLGLGCAALFSSIGSSEWPSGLPAIAWAALLVLVLYPWFSLASVHFRRAVSKGRVFKAVVLIFLPVAIAPLLLAKKAGPVLDSALEQSTLLTAGAYVAAVAAGFVALRLLLWRHYARVDLA